MKTNLPEYKKHFIAFSGEIAEGFSFNRSLGQIFGFLFMSPTPLSLEEIAAGCDMSKGNASLHLRTLETWGAVHRTWKPGTRKDYYSATDDLKKVAVRRLQEGLSKRMEHARQKINFLKGNPAFKEALNGSDAAHWNKRLNEMEELIQQVESGFDLIPKLFQIKSFFK